jgi:hypothetical protein
MQAYHASNSLSSSGYPDIPVGDSRTPNPYAYEVVPPIGRLLALLCDELSIGGCFRPGNRQLADRLGYASAGHIPTLLSQLACEGWIDYDPDTRLITLLRDYRADPAIPPMDQRSGDPIAGSDDDDSALIPRSDRDSPQQYAETRSIPSRDQLAQCMEDHVLVAAALDSESAAARSKIPCAADSIPPMDHRASLLSELGTAPKLIAKALTKRPDLTPGQIRATWSHFEPRIKAGLCSAGAFHAAIANGQIHAAPPDPTAPIDPQAYAGRENIMLGSAPPPEGTIRDRALILAGQPTAETIGSYSRDVVFLQCRLGMGDSDADALNALEKHRKRVRR